MNLLLRTQQEIALTAMLTAWLFSYPLLAQQRAVSIPVNTIQQRLKLYKGDDTKREAALKQLFIEAGCPSANLSEQPVPSGKQPNVICLLPGTTPATIVIGAHFDHTDRGDGVADNWSGASLLPSLLQVLAAAPRRHTFVFIGFSGQENNLAGSDFYVSQLNPEQLAHIEEMIDLDTLGLGPTKVWVSQSDPRLVNTIASLAKVMNLPIAGMDLNGYGISDEESFIAQKVCTLSIHSITKENAHILRSPEDNPTAIHLTDYYDTFRLLAAYLPALDTLALPPNHVCTIQPVDNTGTRTRLHLPRQHTWATKPY
jgi:putative aminopeptidase FrvX